MKENSGKQALSGYEEMCVKIYKYMYETPILS
jgi:hypothetical protein